MMRAPTASLTGSFSVVTATREQQIIQTFVELADTMVEDFDVIEFLNGVADRCVELLDCSEAGVLVADATGLLRVMATTNEQADALELLQSQGEQGPGIGKVRQWIRQINSEDLAADRERWPTFAPAALRGGFRSVQALPMRVRGKSVGALNLFRADAGVIADPDLPLAQGLADIAAVALSQARVVRESRGEVEQLQGALSSRVVIEQAKGILAERVQIGVDAAFIQMRAHARSNNLKLSDVAQDLVRGDLDSAAIGGTMGPERQPA